MDKKMDKVTVIDVGSLHNGTGVVHTPGRLVIAGQRIVAAGHPYDDLVAAALIPEGRAAAHVDFQSCTAIPGLIDTHVHLTLGTGLRTYEQVMNEDSDEVMLLRAAENARTHLQSGVTTVRDLGARGQVALRLRETAGTGVLGSMPSLLVCGRSITAPRGHFWFCGEEAVGAEGVRSSVRRLAGEGADVIKIMATGGGTAGTDRSRAYYSQDELAAGVEEAHRHGLRVVVHAQGTPGIRNAIGAGVDTIEHCDFLGPDGRPSFVPELAERLAEQGMFVDPTLHILRISAELLTKLEDTRRLTPDERNRLDSFRARYEAGCANVTRFRQHGVKLIGGTDAIRKFGDYYLTYETFRECGLPPGEALSAMTAVAAESMGLGEVTGRLAPGLSADVLILDGDLTHDDRALRRVRQVYCRGEAIV